ncbi:hypothetical protein [Arthrobacter sp. NA-172]|uniref:hypothetical protein n=1 Tax=Arthrobacter sp. NA-172 TaxID=3367524 RepID=UPI0037551A8C
MVLRVAEQRGQDRRVLPVPVRLAQQAPVPALLVRRVPVRRALLGRLRVPLMTEQRQLVWGPREKATTKKMSNWLFRLAKQ